MSSIDELQQKLKAEIEAHQWTKIAFEDYRRNHALDEFNCEKSKYLTKDDLIAQANYLINKLTVENKALNYRVFSLNEELQGYKGYQLPGVSPSGIQLTPSDIIATDWEVKPDPQEYYLVLEPIGDIMYLVARNNPPEIGQAIHVREVNHD